MKVMTKNLMRNRKSIRTTSRSRRRRRNISIVTKKVRTKKSQVSRENSSAGGAVLKSVANPYKLTLKDILQPAGNKVETTTVLLNDLWGALMQGHPIDHIPSSKKDLEVG
jgi:phage-related tail protein